MENLTVDNLYLYILVLCKIAVIWSPVIIGTTLYMIHKQRKQQKDKIMTAGQVRNWLDEGPALLLSPCQIADPIPEDQANVFFDDPTSWPRDKGWTIKLLETGEILDVHEETLS